MPFDSTITQIANERWNTLAQELHFMNERDMLVTLYEAMSIETIAKTLKTGTTTIQRRLLIHGISRKKRGGAQNRSGQRYKLFHVDQRLIVCVGLTKCSEMIKVSNATLYKYKMWKKTLTGIAYAGLGPRDRA
jgi:hypothetical protein